ncbi:sensor domain-containing diguanylate cyclase [Zobellella endophytica]|uniref:diguanylate cyclase n=1 Tax=Zobellella endophytica TaxID=2116700 RepID=A0A2P7QXJ0_9GAMM|nr:sensor domain-containing diguanylate cyclase [Zobellella endophytica]PSJ42680.1 sensor domain-containing diguanylate cyclase [Zobellella endophytica]
MMVIDTDSEQQRLAALRRYHILDTPPEVAFDDIARLAAHVCRTPMALINFIDDDRQWFKAALGLGLRELPRDNSICAHVLLQRGLLVIPDTLQDSRFAGHPLVTAAPFLRFYAGVPLETPDGHLIGTLCVMDLQPGVLDDTQAELLKALARQVMRLLELWQANRRQAEMLCDLDQTREELAVLAATDPLTGLANRRAFNEQLRQHYALVQSCQQPACLLMIDIDYFKQFNDEYGHQIGDEALVHFATLARKVFRGTDTIGRWGGEEFLVLLPNTATEQALAVAERLRNTLARTPVRSQEHRLIMTVSIGLIELQPERSLSATLKLLDDTLYHAKEEGRNRTLIAG